jgi:hypothetical protein
MHVIYGLCEPGTEFVRYVGFTKFSIEKRLEEHLIEARARNTCHRHRWLRSLLRQDLKPAIVVLEQVSRYSWKTRERWWIAELRKSNRLVNSTSGGEGLIDPSKSVRQRISRKISKILRGNQYAVGMRHTKEWKKAECERMKAAWAPDGPMRSRKPAVISVEGREALRTGAGTVWINRMGKHKRLPVGLPIPRGWRRGRIYTEEHKANLGRSQKGRAWAHKGSKTRKLAVGGKLPKGWSWGTGFDIPIDKLGRFTKRKAA